MQQELKTTWNDTKSKIKARFGKLTDESIESAKDNLDLLSAKLQSAYGYAREQADKELTNFRATLLKVVEPTGEPVAPKDAIPANVTPIKSEKKTA